ncbi:MAG TPA: hypothetical protein VGO52_20260 [Hyphomonadaceae bacterium]|jgi:hypothetical protein|nr:hypothetical protein [Hyphomonadaceae bacterium]
MRLLCTAFAGALLSILGGYSAEAQSLGFEAASGMTLGSSVETGTTCVDKKSASIVDTGEQNEVAISYRNKSTRTKKTNEQSLTLKAKYLGSSASFSDTGSSSSTSTGGLDFLRY